MGMRNLFSARATTGTSSAVDFSGGNVEHRSNKVMQAFGATTSGTGASTIDLEGSFDQTVWTSLGTVSLTLGTTVTSGKLATTEAWPFFRANVKTLSGTGGNVSVYLGD